VVGIVEEEGRVSFFNVSATRVMDVSTDVLKRDAALVLRERGVSKRVHFGYIPR
jgi:hypothetical protein